MVYRVYVERRPGLDNEARSLLAELQELSEVKNLTGLRLINRYDAEGLSGELFDRCVPLVFSEPQTDQVHYTLPIGCPNVFAVEYLPGQFDQRADSAAQCIQLISGEERPLVRSARVYLPEGDLDDAEIAAIKQYIINPVECREASLEPFRTLVTEYAVPADVAILEGFSTADDAELHEYVSRYGLAMDDADLRCCRDYFASEHRDPTMTELRVLDTYWSDHCRHTTFATILDEVELLDEDAAATYARYMKTREELGRTKPVNLMDLATGGARYLKHIGVLKNLDESPEINACTVKIQVDVDGTPEPWLLLFKNETHNHPTEIEPFGGAATCLGGAIRDPLSGRSYVYQAMRLTGAADPLLPISETMPGKLPQRKIVTAAASGYSSYGNQIGLATGLVDELYHPGYAAKRMEVGAVVGAAPEKNVRREEPAAGDVVLLLGGKTGRDGCGGATGSSKSHDVHSIETCGAEVQKGNAPEERKLQRLFRNPEATCLIKRCNDFGAGGVSVAIGELADGLEINLDLVPKKYEGLDGTELAISESQERMAVVVAAADEARFMELAAGENLETTRVAVVTDKGRLVMHWRGNTIVDLSRAFLDTNGGERHTKVCIEKKSLPAADVPAGFADGFRALADDLNFCSKRGLSEKFDSTIGRGTALMPFGGKYQLTPTQVMAAKLPVLGHDTTTCSVMSYGFDPYLSSASPYHGSYLAVVMSVAKLVAAGAPLDSCYLTFQEYFPKLGNDAKRWGLPAAALLGAFAAQLDLGFGAIGGKDSMSGSFESLDVPPTLISFAITVADIRELVSDDFKQAGSKVMLLAPKMLANGLPDAESLKANFAAIRELAAAGKLRAAWAIGRGGAAEGVLKMTMGNGFGFAFADGISMEDIFAARPGSFLLEVADDCELGTLFGTVTEAPVLTFGKDEVTMAELSALYENKLEKVFPCNIKNDLPAPEVISFPAEKRIYAKVKEAAPQFLIPAFPGTNCEWDTASAIEQAGGKAKIVLVRNLTSDMVAESVQEFTAAARESQVVFIPGGFSGGDEPDGSAKFIGAFFRNPAVTDVVMDLLKNRDGLVGGICNGFQALIKLGLVPYGEIRPMDEDCPTVTFNTISRHQSRLVRTRIASNRSPWLAKTQVGDVYTVPISHGEGRFIASDALLAQLKENGQIATQYVGLDGKPSMDVSVCPNGAYWAIEGITSPDGRVLGKMGHSERIGSNLYQNVPGVFDMQMFAAAVEYFKG